MTATRSERRCYGQVAAIILTESTFNFGAVEAEADAVWPAAVVDVVDVDVVDVDEVAVWSTVPMISTLWPTCGVSFASSASRRYSLAVEVVDEAAVVVDVVPDVPVAPIVALFSTNFASLPRDADVLPVVPTASGAF